MTEHIQLNIDIYQLVVVVSRNANTQETNEFIKRLNPDKSYIRKGNKPPKGEAVYLGNSVYLIKLREDADLGTLCHEIFHIVDFIADNIGIDRDEVSAYLFGEIIRKLEGFGFIKKLLK